MSENTQNRQSCCPAWIWLMLLVGLVLLYFVYHHATSEKAPEIQQDIQSRASQNISSIEQLQHVKVAVDGRDITLSGHASTVSDIQKAEQIAQQTSGARLVHNQISTDQSMEAAQEDKSSKRQAKAKVERLPEEFAPLEDETEKLQAVVDPLPNKLAPLDEESDKQQEASSQVESTKEKFSLLNFSNITFEKNSATLTSGGQEILNQVAQALTDSPSVNIHIYGHSDSTGNPELNLRISKQRTRSVLDYLVGAGIDASRIETTGYGDKFPIAPNDTVAGRIKNRRIEIKVKNGE